METAPHGKWILIGSEDIEIWPMHCTDGYRCINCYFTGKYGCAPRWWHYPPWVKSEVEEPTESHGSYDSLVSLDIVMPYGETIGDMLAGQPLDPMPDGGFTEEMTEILIDRQNFKRNEPYRVIDHNCKRCGCPFLSYRQLLKDHREQYQCPRCGKYYNKDPRKKGWFGDSEGHRALRQGKVDKNLQRKVEKVKPYLKELRGQGIKRTETIERIQERFGVRLSRRTYIEAIKEMGLPLRRKVKDVREYNGSNR